MKALFRSISFVLAAFSFPFFFTTPVYAQEDIRVRVANLTQDVARLTEEVKRLRLDMEEMQRENRRLAAAVNNAIRSQAGQRETLTEVDRRLADLRSEMSSSQSEQRRAIITEVTRQIEKLAKQTQESIDALARAISSQPTPPPRTVTFSDDYPRTGTAYTVQPGDTLSGIASRFGSSVRDIQNANRIDRPQSLRAGETIFIPIPE